MFNKINSFESWQVVVGIINACILLAAFLGALYIGLKQNEINQNLLDLHLQVSVEITYSNKRINTINKGQTNLFLWGTRLNNDAKTLEKQPRLVTPGGSYYILANDLDTELKQKLPKDQDVWVPFEVYLSNQNSKKYIVKCLLLSKLVNGEVTIHAQTLSINPGDWE